MRPSSSLRRRSRHRPSFRRRSSYYQGRSPKDAKVVVPWTPLPLTTMTAMMIMGWWATAVQAFQNLWRQRHSKHRISPPRHRRRRERKDGTVGQRRRTKNEGRGGHHKLECDGGKVGRSCKRMENMKEGGGHKGEGESRANGLPGRWTKTQGGGGGEATDHTAQKEGERNQDAARKKEEDVAATNQNLNENTTNGDWPSNKG